MSASSSSIKHLREPIVNGYARSSTSPCRQKDSFSSKTFCDPVHKQITLHPACVAIIDTPQFQRLRHIKQTGFTCYVYPGSLHDRFGHSLGVCYLAGKFLRELKERQPELKISEIDILCVELAGLCHDLGHGPYSHAWEIFMKNSSAKRNDKRRWKHEIVSANIFDYLIEENGLLPLLNEYGIGEQELDQVKKYILGTQPEDNSKAFLYQIINNDDSGLDVDKFDYFLRDSYYLGLPSSFDYERLIHHAKVFFVEGRTQICFRDKTLGDVYNAFRTRSNFHRLAYQHKVSLIIQEMFLDALEIADEKITFNKEVLHFWKWSMDAAYGTGDKLKSALEKFCMLTDDLVYYWIQLSYLPELKKASDLIKAISKRSCKSSGFYQHIGLKILSHNCKKEEILRGISEFLPDVNECFLSNGHDQDEDAENIKPVSASDICICVVPVNWGKGPQNPVDYVHFYSKDGTSVRNTIDPPEESVILSKSYQEIQVHVLSRRSDAFAVNVVRMCYDLYWKSSNTANHL